MGQQYPEPAAPQAARSERATPEAQARADDGGPAASLPSGAGPLILRLLLLVLAVPAHAAELLGAWDWNADDPDHGGYSAIEMRDGGQQAVVLSDRGRLLDLRIDRTEGGQISTVHIATERTVPAPDVSGGLQDSEGLAISPDGQTFISFEGRSLVAEYLGDSAGLRILPIRPSFEKLKANRGLEALAVAPDGALWTIPEARDGDGFPVSIWRNGEWSDGPVIPRDAGFVPVGLDFDDAGRLYLLERQFLGPFGFRSRVRRFDLDGDTVGTTETLIETDAGQHDNLEGIAVWRDDAGRLIATMVSDDNFFALQRTELVEYILPE